MEDVRTKTECDIRGAFLALLSKERFDAISTTEITLRAKVSRSTFYAYYDSKYALLEAIEDDLIQGFSRIMLELRRAGADEFYGGIKRGHCAFFIRYFQYIRQNFGVFQALLYADGSTNFMSRFSRAITRMRLETIRVWNGLPDTESITRDTIRMYREDILSSLYVSLFAAWINRSMDLSEEEMSRILVQLWIPLADFRI